MSWDGRTATDPEQLMYPPEQQSLTEAAGYSGSAGVKIRQQIALCVGSAEGGDERRGAIWTGTLATPEGPTLLGSFKRA
jgi:hypothetical protein